MYLVTRMVGGAMKNTLTVQLGAIIIGIMIAMLAITSIATYKTAYDKLYDAAVLKLTAVRILLQG